MQRTLLNFWLDATLLLVFLAVLWLTFVLRLVFPPATVAAGWRLWGWSYDQLDQLRFVTTCLFGGAVLLHIMLHWSWVCGVITSRLLRRREGEKKRQWSDGIRTLYGVGLLLAILHALGIAFAAAVLMINSPS